MSGAPKRNFAFPGMNETEELAYNWLKDHEGCTNIAFQKRGTPDFLTDKGGFEVKRIYGLNSVLFSPDQRAKVISTKSKTLVFDGRKPSPCAIIDYTEIGIPFFTKGSIVAKDGLTLKITESSRQERMIVGIRGHAELQFAFMEWKTRVANERGKIVSNTEALEALLQRQGITTGKKGSAGQVFS